MTETIKTSLSNDLFRLL
uniref:Uncharacterized protein n=1 Tax=Rhizophora mucronata TaxID=61149 RepID=A0A2P2PEF8_RHIMU